MNVQLLGALYLLLRGAHAGSYTAAHPNAPVPQPTTVAGTFRVAVCEPRACLAVDSTRAFA